MADFESLDAYKEPEAAPVEQAPEPEPVEDRDELRRQAAAMVDRVISQLAVKLYPEPERQQQWKAAYYATVGFILALLSLDFADLGLAGAAAKWLPERWRRLALYAVLAGCAVFVRLPEAPEEPGAERRPEAAPSVAEVLAGGAE